jgi:hypothetical protein
MNSDYNKIPENMMRSMKNYVSKGDKLGGFLQAIFANDLLGSFSRADKTNLPLISIYVTYVHWETPFQCHGSYEIIQNWINEKQNLDK